MVCLGELHHVCKSVCAERAAQTSGEGNLAAGAHVGRVSAGDFRIPQSQLTTADASGALIVNGAATIAFSCMRLIENVCRETLLRVHARAHVPVQPAVTMFQPLQRSRTRLEIFCADFTHSRRAGGMRMRRMNEWRMSPCRSVYPIKGPFVLFEFQTQPVIRVRFTAAAVNNAISDWVHLHERCEKHKVQFTGRAEHGNNKKLVK